MTQLTCKTCRHFRGKEDALGQRECRINPPQAKSDLLEYYDFTVGYWPKVGRDEGCGYHDADVAAMYRMPSMFARVTGGQGDGET